MPWHHQPDDDLPHQPPDLCGLSDADLLAIIAAPPGELPALGPMDSAQARRAARELSNAE
jgi:hypothetical protein